MDRKKEIDCFSGSPDAAIPILGALDNQIRVVSYGKEKPLALEGNEFFWESSKGSTSPLPSEFFPTTF